MARPEVQRRQKHHMMSGFLTLSQAFYLLQLFLTTLVLVDGRQFDIQKRFTKNQVCKDTIRTIEKVDSCPSNDSSLQKRIQVKQCGKVNYSSCSDETYVYHCVRFHENLVEVCAPRGLITGGCCAQFNEGVGRVIEDYTVLCSECPLNYYTNEASKYPTCVQQPVRANKTTKSSLQNDQPITQVSKSLIPETINIDCDTPEPLKRHVKCIFKPKSLTKTTEATSVPTSSESNERINVRQNIIMPTVIFISIGTVCIVIASLLYCSQKRLFRSCSASKESNGIFDEKTTENGKLNVQHSTKDWIAIPKNEIHDSLLQNRSSSTDIP